MSYSITYTGMFKKDYKRIVKRGYNIKLLQDIIDILVTNGNLPKNTIPIL